MIRIIIIIILDPIMHSSVGIGDASKSMPKSALHVHPYYPSKVTISFANNNKNKKNYCPKGIPVKLIIRNGQS